MTIKVLDAKLSTSVSDQNKATCQLHPPSPVSPPRTPPSPLHRQRNRRRNKVTLLWTMSSDDVSTLSKQDDVHIGLLCASAESGTRGGKVCVCVCLRSDLCHFWVQWFHKGGGSHALTYTCGRSRLQNKKRRKRLVMTTLMITHGEGM